MRHPHFYSVLLYLLIFLSGFAGLGYEMAWTRMLAVGLGHEYVAVLAVVGAFFCGMALGAGSLDGIISRSKRPGRWYAGLEIVIGVWSLALIALIPVSNRLAAALIGIAPSWLLHWSVAFVLPFFVLLPATAAMGATLPAMERLFSGLRRSGWSVGGVYAANTFGGMAGTLATTFAIAPVLGFRATLMVLAGLNIICAAGVLLISLRKEAIVARPSVAAADNAPPLDRILLTLFLTGFLGIGYEVLVVRVLSLTLENTVYSFAGILCVYLFGTAAGAALYQRLAPRRRFDEVLIHLMQFLALACLVGLILLWHSDQMVRWIRMFTGRGITGAVAAEMITALAVFLLPTVGMGASFSHLAQAARRDAGGVGWALSVNTLGASLAPFVFGVVLLPAIGSKLLLLSVSVIYLALCPHRQWQRWLPAAVPAALAVFLLVHQPERGLIDLPPNSRLAAHIEGVTATVTILEDARRDVYLKVNNKFEMGSTASIYSDRRQAHIPLLLHPDPRSALFLGLGTGATFAACTDYPGLQAEGVELVPEIVAMLPWFEKSTGDLGRFERLQIRVADARRYIQASPRAYDVIVADLFHPARDGAGSLYTAEHFTAVRARLNPGGIFCQWLPLYQMDLETLRVIVGTFLEVFPSGSAYLATYSLKTPMIGLIGGRQPVTVPRNWLERATGEALRKDLQALKLDTFFSLPGCFLADADSLEKFAGNAPINTDDYPVVIFQAPRFTYGEDEPAHVRLLDLVDRFDPLPADVFGPEHAQADAQIHRRLADYWTARKRFLHAGVGVKQTRDVRHMLSQVREPLLAIVRQSPDFEPAYFPLLAMAQSLHRSDPEAADTLLIELEAANPKRQEATHLRRHLERLSE